MPDDPRAKRLGPAPAHPSGYPALDDGPVHLAPAVDARLVPSEDTIPDAPDSSTAPTPPLGQPVVEFTLDRPVEERVSQRPPPRPSPPQTIDFERPRTLPSSKSGESAATTSTPTPSPAPAYVAWSSSSPPSPSGRHRTSRPASGEPPSGDLDRDALVRELAAIGRLTHPDDREGVRDVALRATLARARALRFRLTLHDVWPSAQGSIPPGPAHRPRPLDLDLALECALLAAIADGARGGDDDALPVVAVLVQFFRALRPDLPRTTLRDRGASVLARLTITGWNAALEQLGKIAQSAPPEARKTALELACRSALAPQLNDQRFAALSDLERALAVPTGSLARALDEARGAV